MLKEAFGNNDFSSGQLHDTIAISEAINKAMRTIASFLSRVHDILWRRDIEYAEIQGSLLSLLWGVWLFHSYYDKSNSERSFTYDSLLKVCPHEVWGSIFILVGAVQFAGLLFASYRMRRVGTLLATMLWLFVGSLLAMDEWHMLTCPTVFAFAVGSGWGFIRIGRFSTSPK
jgi:hypothetical protein